MIPKVHILVQCTTCNGKAYVPIGEAVDPNGQPYIQYHPCPTCEGSGNQAKWVNLTELVAMLEQAQCPHKHTSFRGGFHFSAGDVWDDIQEYCDDCGVNLDRQKQPIDET